MSETFQTTTVRTARRVRHETKMRLLQVREVSRLTPKMARVVLGSEALAGFVSAAHDGRAATILRRIRLPSTSYSTEKGRQRVGSTGLSCPGCGKNSFT